eukprot:8386079-Heterocapsa_arctica.AAC.1
MDDAFTGKPIHLTHKEGTIYTDGSAVFPRDLPMRRAAYGIWVGKHNWHNVSLPLPGKVQTAYRAELQAIVHVAERFTGGLTIFADSLGVVSQADRIFKGGKASTTGKHADLSHRWEAASLNHLGGISK